MTTRTYRAIFFDLDGTLLPMDVDVFMKQYFAVLGKRMLSLRVPQEAFMTGMKRGIMAMATNDTGLANSELFWPAFMDEVCAYVSDDVDVASEIADFYENDFGLIGQHFDTNPAAARAIEVLKSKGYPLVLATMPMFPRRAVEWRVTWAGIDPAVFSRITTFDNSTSVKPKPNYYAETLAACGLNGSDVLMVGNNTKEDLAAMALGCDGYLITDNLIDPIEFDISQVKHGSMEDFTLWVESLPPCANPAENISDDLVSAQSRNQVLKASGISDGTQGGVQTLEEAGQSGGGNASTFHINGVDA